MHDDSSLYNARISRGTCPNFNRTVWARQGSPERERRLKTNPGAIQKQPSLIYVFASNVNRNVSSSCIKKRSDSFGRLAQGELSNCEQRSFAR
jgi:hypothetical protein